MSCCLSFTVTHVKAFCFLLKYDFIDEYLVSFSIKFGFHIFIMLSISFRKLLCPFILRSGSHKNIYIAFLFYYLVHNNVE